MASTTETTTTSSFEHELPLKERDIFMQELQQKTKHLDDSMEGLKSKFSLERREDAIDKYLEDNRKNKPQPIDYVLQGVPDSTIRKGLEANTLVEGAKKDLNKKNKEFIQQAVARAPEFQKQAAAQAELLNFKLQDPSSFIIGVTTGPIPLTTTPKPTEPQLQEKAPQVVEEETANIPKPPPFEPLKEKKHSAKSMLSAKVKTIKEKIKHIKGSLRTSGGAVSTSDVPIQDQLRDEPTKHPAHSRDQPIAKDQPLQEKTFQEKTIQDKTTIDQTPTQTGNAITNDFIKMEKTYGAT